MKKTLILVAILCFAMTFAQAQPPTDVSVSGAWARPTTMGMDSDEAMEMDMMKGATSAVYMTITNESDSTLRFVAAQTTVAGIVEIHETSMGDNDVMQMRPVEGSIEIPAGEQVELRPGGLHIMMLDLQANLLPSDAFMLTLMLESDSGDMLELPLAVPVTEFPPLPGDIVVTQAWARPTAPATEMDMDNMMATEEPMDMGGTSAAYMFIENTGSEDVTLISGTTNMAGIVEIHETSMTDQGVMQMRPVEGGIVIPAGERVELRPGGLHVMMLDLQMPFVDGEALFLELAFDNGETIAVAAPIEDRMGMMSMGE